MTSINQIFFQGGPQLGEVRAGLAASAWGVPFAIISGGIWTIIAALLILAKWPAVRQYDTHEPAPQPAPATTDQASGRLHSNHPKDHHIWWSSQIHPKDSAGLLRHNKHPLI